MSFRLKIMLLVALAVSLPSVATCIVLGLQLNSQARALFSSRLQGDLEVFVLLIRDLERNLVEGARRTAADNTLQVTLELGIGGQLASYLNAQRSVMGSDLLAAYDATGKIAAAATARGSADPLAWRLSAAGIAPAACHVAPDAERQIIFCNGTAWLVAAIPIVRLEGDRGDGATRRNAALGLLVGAVRAADPMLLAALQERQLGHGAMWTADALIHAPPGQANLARVVADSEVREYEFDNAAFLGAARSIAIGRDQLTVGLFAPLEPLRNTLLRSVLTVAGIGLAVVAVVLLILRGLVTRMLSPILQLQEGTLRIGHGDLAHRIDIRTGDELQTLAEQFNDMTSRLQSSYAGLETKVEERTHALSEALQSQTAMAETLKIIARSQFDPQPVFEAVVRSAALLCRSSSAFLFQREAAAWRLVAQHGLSRAHYAFVQQVQAGGPPSPLATGMDDKVGVLEIADASAETAGVIGFRTMISVPLVRDGQAAGMLALGRELVLPFSEREIGLLLTFADQAVIALDNVRLVDELKERTRELAQSRLRRFLAPQVAELLNREEALESRRCEVTVVFCDLRGFTGFAERAEPEEVMAMMHDYHETLGELIFRFEGTLERFVGDGLVVVFNDPLPIADHPLRAVRMAITMQEHMRVLLARWRRQGHELGFGVGIAQGYATVGPIGFDQRLDYAVIGSTPNLASRLCDAAQAGQILVSQRVSVSIEDEIASRRIGDLTLKGFERPVPAFEIIVSSGGSEEAALPLPAER